MRKKRHLFSNFYVIKSGISQTEFDYITDVILLINQSINFEAYSIEPVVASEVKVTNLLDQGKGKVYAEYRKIKDLFLKEEGFALFANESNFNESFYLQGDTTFRSSHTKHLTTCILEKALTAGGWIIRNIEEIKEWAQFDEIYEDRTDSPIRNDVIYSQIEHPIIKVNNPLKVRLGYGSRIYARSKILNSESLVLGVGSHIGTDCEINMLSNLNIGNFTMISSFFKCIGQNHTFNNLSNYSLGRGPFGFLGIDSDKSHIKDINIGSDVWIGTGVTILPGVTIGNGAVIGAGSVVTKDVKGFTINAGVPCKYIKDRFSKNIIRALEKSKWWNWSSHKLYKYKELFNQEIDDTIIEKLKIIEELEVIEYEEQH